MKKTAHGNPIFISNGNSKILTQINEFSEKQIQDLIFEHPDCLPISDIDESYNPVIPICTELWTPAGPLDILMGTPNGDLVIIETKLWYNPEARRKVIAQILDYAKELTKWTYSDLQREVNKRLKTKGNSLYSIMSKKNPDLILSEKDFADSVSRNLRIGKILLIIAGDGIREGAKEISEFLNKSAGLNFTLSLIEMPIFKTDDGEIIIFPRTSLKTTEIQKINVEIPKGLILTQDAISENPTLSEKEVSPEIIEKREVYNSFWSDFVAQLNFDDPGQLMPNPTISQNIFIYPGLAKASWISAYFSPSSGVVGVYYRFYNNQKGQMIKEQMSPYTEEIKDELGEGVIWTWDSSPTNAFNIVLPISDVHNPENKQTIIDFFNEWTNKFVNVVRPRLKQIES